MKKHFLLLAIIFISLISFNSIYAETDVSGIISTDTTWILVNSPYVIQSEVGIPEGTTLIIDPGVEIIFNKGALKVHGSLQAIGTPEKPILFTGNNRHVDSQIIFDQSHSTIQYSIIEQMWEIDGNRSYLTISDNIICNNNIGIVSEGGKIFNNLITDNDRGIIVSGGVEVSKNEIVNNRIGVSTCGSGSIIFNNNIYNNSDFNIFTSRNTSSSVNVSNNWWGNTDESSIESKIFDYYNNIDFAIAEYKPYALEKFSNTSNELTIKCFSFVYSNWSDCSSSGQQTRTIISSSPSGCSGGIPILTQSCTYIEPTCNSWEYSNWSDCSSSGQQTRTIISSSPSGCKGGDPVLNKICEYVPLCDSDVWVCEDWGECLSNELQFRKCIKTFDCPNIQTPSPEIKQYCEISKNVLPNIENDEQTIISENKTADLQEVEQRKNEVVNEEQEQFQIIEKDNEIGEDVEAITQTQIQNQEKLEIGIQKIQSRNSFVKFFIGPDYSEIKNLEKVLKQNKEQIQKLNEIKIQVVDQEEESKALEQIQILEDVDQEVNILLDESKKGFSIFGWIFEFFGN